MKRLLVAVLALLCLLGAQCNPSPQPAPGPAPEPTPAPVPSPEPPPPLPGDGCAVASEHAASLGCPLAGSGSSSWADVCRNAAKNAVTMHQKCIASASSCAAITVCLKSTK